MNAISNNKANLDYASYVKFAEGQIETGEKKAIVRFGTAEGARTVVRCADGDYVGRIGALRGGDRAAANNDVRAEFLKAVLARCGKAKVADLPTLVQKALTIKDFKLDDKGNVTSGKPLTARRICAIDAAIRKSVLEPHQDPTSDVPMRQANSGLCPVNSIINALKLTKNGQAYLSKMFRPDGCTLYTAEMDDKTKKLIRTPYEYDYSKARDYPKREEREENFSLLERTMVHHQRTRSNTTNSRGFPGAQMLGLDEMQSSVAWPPEETQTLSGRINKLRQHLNKGYIIVAQTVQHYVAIIGIDDKGICTYVDDVYDKDCGPGQTRTLDLQYYFRATDFHVIKPPADSASGETGD